jgi:LmbE family N-acetylglucosaminyl deacetylase/ActR/RegA family two-component response regulator
MSDPFRVIVVEDDPDVALFAKTVLEKRELCVVMTIGNPFLVAEAVDSFEPDVIVSDIEMPGMTGLEILDQVRSMRPGIPVIMMTAHASFDYALQALRSQADEFLTKPVSSSVLAGHVIRLGEAARARAATEPRRQVVLAIGAHPDDVEIGIGGTLAAHAAAGDSITILTLSAGDRDGGIQNAWAEGSRSAAIVGATLVLEPNAEAFISATEPTTSIIRRLIDELDPTIIYTHSKNEQGQDHRAVYEATVAAAGSARTIASYQGTGATVEFQPNRFVTIDGFVDVKNEMLSCFGTLGDRHKFLDPEFTLATARSWSRYGQGAYCEALEIIRETTRMPRLPERPFTAVATGDSQ